MAKNPRLIDLTGQIFGLWAVLRQDGNTRGGAAIWLCECKCGAIRRVLAQDLRGGKSTSCGCVGRNRLGDAARTHGGSGTRLHCIWTLMLSRCRNKNNPVYGGRGISVCEQWQDFSAFRDWALCNGYGDGLSIDRLDNDKGYSPENCRWATALMQSRNRRFVALASDGRPGCEVARENGIPVSTYNQRRRDGWSIDEAATRPYRKRRNPYYRDTLGRFF